MSYGSVIFDLDGVLLDSTGNDEWKYDATKSALSELGVDASVLDEGVLDGVLGEEGYEECVRVCEELGVDPETAWSLVAEKTSEARLEKIQNNGFGLVDDVKPVLEELRQNRVKLGVISNAPDQAVENVIDYFGLERYFKFYRGVTSFEDLKMNKPHPDHLELAKVELGRGSFVYVGDRESDVEAASCAGIDSVWICADDFVEPDYTVEKLVDLTDVLELN